MQEARKIEDIDLQEKMKEAYLDYSMSVIVGRALPDVRDGLKPVHRRILYAMWDMGLKHTQAYKKSARVVGDVLGKYHPHGDQAVYDAFVRMAQDFSLRYPLVDGKGNFGSLDGDSPAAMRYTAGRLTQIAEEMLYDMDKNTVEFRDNFDGSLKEPVVLPSKVPNLLINGASGIAVGMATNIPPHNLSEVIDALITYIEEPSPDLSDLMTHIKGPDFPTGGKIIGKKGIKEAYRSGKGKITNRASVDVLREDDRLVVQEIPYNVKKSKIVEQIADLVKENKVDGIRDLRDESDREGLRIVIDLKRKSNPDVVLNKLFKKTSMEKTFGVTNLAIVDGEPELLNLKEILNEFVEHRVKVIRDRTQYLLNKAQNRIHILDGLLIALNNIDTVVELIQNSDNKDNAKEKLIKNYELDEKQSKAILRMRLQKLTGLEKTKLKEEHKEVKEEIKEYKTILSSRENILEVIKDELIELKEKYGDKRRTQIKENTEEIDEIDLIPEEKTVITLTKNQYIKRTALSEFRKQKRSGRGLISMNLTDEDKIIQSKVVSTHDYLLLFTNKGNVYWLRSHRIPEYGRRSQGRPILNLLTKMDSDEKIHSITSLGSLDKNNDLLFATEKGKVKRTPIKEFSNPRPSGIIAIRLHKNDRLIGVKELEKNQDVVLLSSNGKAIRFPEKEVSPTARNTLGVKGMELSKDQKIKALTTIKEDQELLTVTSKGYGKRTQINEYRRTHRAGKGVKAMKVTQKNGEPIEIAKTNKEDDFFITTEQGYSIRIQSDEISKQSRTAMGVKLVDLRPNDKLISIDKINP